jgi:pimeloyl-ACP methyl ester carboxylesterase
MTLRTTTAAGVAVLTLVLPTGTPAGTGTARAARVAVPADRSDPAAGTIGLNVRRLRATGRAGGTLMYLAGGPGSAATAELRDIVGGLGPAVRRRRHLVAFDARGTGRSGLVSCPELQRDRRLRSTAAAAACAERLGARRGRFSVAEQVEDVEAVRRSVGVSRIDLFGVSYGTEIAQRYAQAYPRRVGRVVLDSVLPTEGPSAIGLEVFRGLPRVLDELCTLRRCRRGMPDPRSSVPALVERLRAGPLRAPVFDARGRARTGTLDRVALLDLLLAGDFSPGIRAALPAAVAAANRGDAALLLRLAALDERASPIPDPDVFSVGLYAATSCEGLAFPWDPSADPATRRAQAAAELARLGPAPFVPFDPETVLDADFLPLCIGWPAPVRSPAPAPPPTLPPVPMLAIAGEEDLRTPVESARTVVERNPRARLLTVPGTGHSVVSADDSGCAARAASAFLLGTRGPRRCPGPRPVVPPVAEPPASLGALGSGGTARQRVARTLRAIDRTLDDVTLALVTGAQSGGGLRGGGYRFGADGVTLRRYAFVPGVLLDGRPREDGSLRIRIRGAGAAAGTVRVDSSGRVRGRLGGRRVRGVLSAGPPQG